MIKLIIAAILLLGTGLQADDSLQDVFFEVIDEPATETFSVYRFFGKLHLVVLHFPIAWAGLASILSIVGLKLRRQVGNWDLVMLILAFIAMVPTLATGWLRSDDMGLDSQELLNHRNAAFISAGIMSLAIAVNVGVLRRKLPRWLGVAAILTGFSAIAFTAHLGGSLVFGKDFLFR